jgi:predicted ester cyclase
MPTRASVVEFLEHRQRAWTARDPVMLGNTHAENGTVQSPIFSTLTGRPAITDAYRALFHIFTDWRLTASPAIIDGTRVAEPFTVTATHTGSFMGLEATGRHFEIHGMLVFELTPEPLIAEERRIYDFTGLLIQVGVLRGKPAF